MPTRIQSRLETILPIVKTQIITATSIDPTRVFATLSTERDLMMRAPSDRFIALRPTNFPIWDGAVTGGGNDDLWMHGELDITLFVRYGVDQSYADDSWLLDSTAGVLALWSNLIHGLQLYDPVDGSGNQVLSEPMRLHPTGWKLRTTTLGNMSTWGRLASTWELQIRHAV